MSDLAEMRKQLRELRKDSVKPVSRMRKGDISAEIEKLRMMRETTAAPAAVPSSRPRAMAPSVESVKKAKSAEFPVKPSKESKALGKSIEAAGTKKKGSKLERMMKMIEEMSSSDEE